ncbi:pre-mRNA-splicing factor SYF2 [Bacillus rossius redtenbacheri]|uniref:pre-mRNA-splicing factor SYF2 n=1 Tax=Bacillus rossius redtenbacheri TaxID=93214 RepID=UPI002FDDBB2C
MEAAASSNSSFKEKLAERMQRLKELHVKRNEARQLNHQEVVEEDKRSQLPSNWESQKRRAEWVLEDEKQRDQASARGEDYDRVKLLHVQAIDAERMERKKKKKNPDPGFSDYEQATFRQYSRLVRNIKPDMQQYERQRQKVGEAFYGGRNTILHGLHEDSKEGVEFMVQDLEKMIAKREKYSRRRIHNDDADIDYINERNMRFNKKLERYYGEHTTEIKQNLERGTAV